MARKDGTATPAVSKKRDITDQVGRHRPSDAALLLTKSSARIINFASICGVLAQGTAWPGDESIVFAATLCDAMRGDGSS